MMADPETGPETGSGKGAADENFPVGSILIPKALRPDVMCYYNFAREIDDIADNPSLSTEEKIARLTQFRQALSKGSQDPELGTASKLHHVLKAKKISLDRGLDLISAFEQDARQSRYENWTDLIDYCQRSAAPVGRFLLDLHGEDPALYPASDALCHALQIINHLQDVLDDKQDMDRVYVPLDWLSDERLNVDDIKPPQTSPALRRVFDKMLDGTSTLLDQSRRLAPNMQNRHLSAETRVIQSIAETLTKRLYKQDPIATRVELSKPVMLMVSLKGLLHL